MEGWYAQFMKEALLTKKKDGPTEAWFFDVLGNIDLLRYMTRPPLQKGYRWEDVCKPTNGDWAAHHGHLNLIKYAERNGKPLMFTPLAMDLAARNGDLKVVKWLHKNRKEGCTTDAMDHAARNGHLQVVQWLHENRTEGCTWRAMDRAWDNDHRQVFHWLHENRREGTSYNILFSQSPLPITSINKNPCVLQATNTHTPNKYIQ
jgi:hypothetical protein